VFSVRPVLIFGAGQVAAVFAEYMNGALFVVDPGFVSVALYEHGSMVFTDDLLSVVPPPHPFIVGMSFKGLNRPRAEKFEWMRGLGYEPLTFVHHDVWVPNSAKVGAGTFIMDRNTIQTGVEIGENCVLWSHNHVGHHAKIGNHVWLSSGIVVSGACEIGDFSFIGSGATIVDGVKIGKRCIIGAGATITSDCNDDGVYPGPAAARSMVPSFKLKGVWAQ
jgi:sugar O-acyltransferase (sialic acid O-acetyltransferase NeuD family)